jgi:hypothetical protein
MKKMRNIPNWGEEDPRETKSRTNESNQSPIQTKSKRSSLSFSKCTKVLFLSFKGFEKKKVVMVVLLFENMEDGFTGYSRSDTTTFLYNSMCKEGLLVSIHEEERAFGLLSLWTGGVDGRRQCME